MTMHTSGLFRVSLNLGLKVANAGLALLAVLLLREVAPIATAADLVLAQVIAMTAAQLVALPLGQDLLRHLSASDGVPNALEHLRLAVLRGGLSALLTCGVGMFATEWLFPGRGGLRTFLLAYAPLVMSGCIALVLGHVRASRKDMFGFIIGQGLIVNLASSAYLGALLIGVGGTGFSTGTYLVLINAASALVAGAMAWRDIRHSRRAIASGASEEPLFEPRPPVRTKALAGATTLGILVQQLPTPLVGMCADADFVVQFFLVQRFAAQFALISNAMTIQFVPRLMRAFVAAETEHRARNAAAFVLAEYRKVNLRFGLPGILVYGLCCAMFLHQVTPPALWPVTRMVILCLFLPSALAALLGLAGPTLVAARRETALAMSFASGLAVLALAFVAQPLLSLTGISAMIGGAQFLTVMLQYLLIRRLVGLDIAMGASK